MIEFLLGLQSGYTKFPCFLCLWNNRARKELWTRKDWPMRSELIPGSLNDLALPMVERSKIVFPPLRIKLGIMKQFVKGLAKNGDCFIQWRLVTKMFGGAAKVLPFQRLGGFAPQTPSRKLHLHCDTYNFTLQF